MTDQELKRVNKLRDRDIQAVLDSEQLPIGDYLLIRDMLQRAWDWGHLQGYSDAFTVKAETRSVTNG